MFIKGMKYEFRAVARIVLPMFIVSLCAAMIMSMGFILDGRVFHFTAATENEVLPVLFGIAEVLVGLGLIFLMIAINIAVFIMIVHRFYVSFFTDEGYLTFTLPLTIDCHLMIKLVSMFLWNLLTLIVTVISFLIILPFEISVVGCVDSTFLMHGNTESIHEEETSNVSSTTIGISAKAIGMLVSVIGREAISESRKVVTRSESSSSPICLFPMHHI